MSFKIVLITSPEDFADEHVLLEAMFQRGLERLHVRKPRKDLRSMEKWILELEPDFRSRLVVHGYAELVQAFGLAGFHGTHGNSASFHSFAEILESSQPYDYGFLSPIFDSYSKIGYKAAFSEEQLRNQLRDYKSRLLPHTMRLLGLGGVDEERLSLLKDWGFDGAAILGAVWNAADPLAAWVKIVQEAYRLNGLSVPQFPAVESWRDVLQPRRGGVQSW